MDGLPKTSEVLAGADEPLDFSRRWTGVELMDDPACDEALLLRTVQQFETINRLVSRYQTILTRHVLRDMERDPARTYHLIDAGAGGCEIAVWLLAQAKRKGLSLRITAFDGDERTVNFARTRYSHVEGLLIEHADLFNLERFGPADYVFSNHVMHHLPDALIPRLLSLMDAVATRGWMVSDLHRSPWSYLGFQIIGRCFRNSFAFEDGKRSIRRGFVRADMMHYVESAGLRSRVHVEQMIPGRILLTSRSNQTTRPA